MNYKRILNSSEFSFSSDSWIFCVIQYRFFISTIYCSIVFIDLLNNYRTKPHILKRMALSPPKVWMNDILTPKGQMIDWGTNCLCFQYCDRIIRFFCIIGKGNNLIATKKFRIWGTLLISLPTIIMKTENTFVFQKALIRTFHTSFLTTK